MIVGSGMKEKLKNRTMNLRKGPDQFNRKILGARR